MTIDDEMRISYDIILKTYTIMLKQLDSSQSNG